MTTKSNTPPPPPPPPPQPQPPLADDECPNETTHFYAFEEYAHVCGLIEQLPSTSSDLRRRELANQQFKLVCDKYQEQPHLVDPYLASMYEKLIGVVKTAISPETKIEKSAQIELINEAFTYMHLLAKMRGYKRIVQYLPHETADLEPVVRLLEAQDLKNVDLWQTRYMLLIWLSIVCMIPFDLTRFDNTERPDAEKIKERLLRVCVPYLSSGDACQDASAFLLAKFMSRQDVRETTLPTFFRQLVDSIAESNASGDFFRLLGALKCLACIFKYGRREDLLKYTAPTLSALVQLDLLTNKLSVIRKFYIKVIQRVGTTLFKLKVAKWRYQRGSRVLMNLVNQNSDNAMTSENNKENKPQTAATTTTNEADDDSEQIPVEIEEIIEQLLSGLRDKDTIVRWSSAKGIGRITNRLGLEPAEDVLSSLLDLFTYVEDDLAWHGGCLALAELARRGLLLPSQLPNVVPIVLNALVFDKKLGNYSLGTNVRDSACYVCWAFARAFEPDVIGPYVAQIAARLLVVAVFDREINCRRAASAAFQENVGRQGQFPHGIEIVTECDYHAVGQLPNCYLNLATFICSFDEYRQSMIDHLVEHKFNYWDVSVRELAAQCLHNLTRLCPDYMAFCILPKLIKSAHTAIDLNTRHGALHSLGQLIHALCSTEHADLTRLFPAETMSGLKTVVDRIFDEKYFRGSGGEFLRPAVCFFIKKLAMSDLIVRRGSADAELSATFIRDCDQFMAQCIEYNKESVQAAAVETLPFYCDLKYKAFRSGEQIQDSQLVDTFIRNLTDPANTKEHVRSGYSLALGNLPAYLLATNDGFTKSVRALISSAAKPSDSSTTTTTSSWVYARRDAIRALSRLFKLTETETFSSLIIPTDLILDSFECYFNALGDYTLDAKGDSGCHVREASLDAIDSLVELVSATHRFAGVLSNCQLIQRVLTGIVQQAVERIDRTRALAGRVFSRVLYNSKVIVTDSIEHLRRLFPADVCASMDWNADHVTLPVFARLVRREEFQDCVLVGLVYSIGSLTESLRKAATGSFLKELKSIEREDTNSLRVIMNKLLVLCRTNLKSDRLSSSLIRAVDLIVQDGLLKTLPDMPHLFLSVFIENVNTTKDIQRLTSYVDLFCDMLQFDDEPSRESRVRVRAMQQLMIMLCHQYPRVRKSTAQRLFEALINYPDVFEADADADECTTLLSETDWDQSVDKCREVRNRLCDLTKTPRPVLKKKIVVPSIPPA